jgi:uncharacterized membrane protein YeaQ/YmgE (transglycosylase-associated protein family)
MFAYMFAALVGGGIGWLSLRYERESTAIQVRNVVSGIVGGVGGGVLTSVLGLIVSIGLPGYILLPAIGAVLTIFGAKNALKR